MNVIHQIKRSLSGRKSHDRARDTASLNVNSPPLTPKDSKSVYSFELDSDAKSFFSFDFEKGESEAFCEFDATPHHAQDSTLLSVDRARGTIRYSLPPPYDRLEWILLHPSSPVARNFVGMLSINDVVSLSQVCQSWRGWLTVVPSTEYGNDTFELHPLVSTVIAPTQPLEEVRDFAEPLGYYGRYHRHGEEYWRKFELSIPRLIGVFGQNYLAGITALHLDDAKLEDGFCWLSDCRNLESLSIRKCEGITLDGLAELLLFEDEEEPNKKKKKRRPSAPRLILDKLEVVRFWGIDGARRLAHPHHVEDSRDERERLETQCEKLMERYRTDVCWKAGEWNSDEWKLLIAMTETCGVCEKVWNRNPRNYLGCEEGIACERCLGYICEDCLELKTVERSAAGVRDGVVPLSPTTNMLELVCNMGGICGWGAVRHYVHPRCIPPATLLWGHNDFLRHVFELYRHLTA